MIIRKSQQKCSCFLTAGQILKVLSSDYEVLFETIMRFDSKQHAPEKERKRRKKRRKIRCRSQPVNRAVFSTSASCQLPRTVFFLQLVSVCHRVSPAPLNNFGNSNMKTYPRKEEAKIAEQLPIVAGQIAGLLNQRFMPNYHNRRIFFVYECVLPGCTCSAAPIRKFKEWKELRLTFIQIIYKIYTCISI